MVLRFAPSPPIEEQRHLFETVGISKLYIGLGTSIFQLVQELKLALLH